jgi:hypothetical protein
LAGHVLASGPGGVALVFGVTTLRLGRPVSAAAIQEHRMLLEAVCAAVVRLGYTLARPVRPLLRLRAAAL